MPDYMVEAHINGVRNALAAGWSVLTRGGAALDAIEEALVVGIPVWGSGGSGLKGIPSASLGAGSSTAFVSLGCETTFAQDDKSSHSDYLEASGDKPHRTSTDTRSPSAGPPAL
jgi:hypothetical protein